MNIPEKPSLFINGAEFESLESFAQHFSARVLSGYHWSGNLDALNDILGGGFGAPENGFKLVWLNSAVSKKSLGYAETAKQLQRRLSNCHPTNRDSIAAQLAQAQAGKGSTVFDWLVEIIREHGEGGAEAESGIELELR